MAYYTYKQVGEFVLALREARGRSIDSATVNAWNRILNELPDIVEVEVSEERTNEIINMFISSARSLASSTKRNYTQAFRVAVQRFSDYIEYKGAANFNEIPDYLALKEGNDTEPEPPVSKPKSTQQRRGTIVTATREAFKPPSNETNPPLTTYNFLLRPGMRIAVPIPDDLTDNEVERFATWLSTFVLASSH